MALQFPASASVGQTYASGSSNTYQWTGLFWKILSPNSESIAIIARTASYAPQRQNVTWLQSAGMAGTLFIAGDNLYAIKGNNADYDAYSAAPGLLVSGTIASNFNVGIKQAYLVDFPTETGSRLVSASANKYTGLALFDNGNLYGWGTNTSGELGLGAGSYNVAVHQPKLINTAVADIYPNDSTQGDDLSYDRVLIKKTDGYVYGSGYNGRGGLGLGSATASYVSNSVRLDGIGQNPLFVANFGSQYGGIIAQKSNGQIVGCGANNNGWLGDGSTTQRNSFVTLSAWLAGDSTMKIKKVFGSPQYYASGFASSYGYMNMWISSSDGNGQKIMFAGNGYYGASGNGRGGNVNYTTPMSASLPASSVFRDVVWANSPVCIYAWTGSSVYSWGKNDYGQLGYSSVDATPQAWPSASLMSTAVVDILGRDATAYQNSYLGQSPVFKSTDGNYYMCGYGQYGQLGIGENTVSARVTSLRRIDLPISESLKFVGSINTDSDKKTYIAVTDDNRFYVWGRNNGYNTVDAYSAYDFFFPVQKTPQILFK